MSTFSCYHSDTFGHYPVSLPTLVRTDYTEKRQVLGVFVLVCIERKYPFFTLACLDKAKSESPSDTKASISYRIHSDSEEQLHLWCHISLIHLYAIVYGVIVL